MVFTKKFTKESLILFLFLALLPFGQLLRLPVSLLGTGFHLNPADLVVFSAMVATLLSKKARPVIWKDIKDFLLVTAFSLVFSLAFFDQRAIFLGLFYYLRLVAYFFFFVFCWHLFRQEPSLKDRTFRGLIFVTLFAAIFGWIQYFFYPDLRPLVSWGWDDHFLRMAGTFLDPAFTGVFLVFGAILGFLWYFQKQQKKRLALALFLLVSLAFTYSRASYLALGAGFLAIAVLQKKLKGILVLLVFFSFVVLVLPRGPSEGVRLERLASVIAKSENYRQSLILAKISPLFGIGFNNVCLAKKTYLGETNLDSHSCSGLDSSLLLVLATTGIAGFFSFVNLIIGIGKNLKKGIYGQVFIACALGLFVHSLFVNSFFYSWVMGLMAVLLALAI